MLISIQAILKYETPAACSLLLQIEAAQDASQVCETSNLAVRPDVAWNIISGEDDIGVRRWGRISGVFDCSYRAQVRVNRPPVNLPTLHAHPVAQLPNDATKFLMPSRYCHPETFLAFVPKQFGNLNGGPLIQQMADWIAAHFTYDNSASTAVTTATESFDKRAGVCRDYAHVLIAMARSVGIPARMASVYAPDVSPQDFHAVVEVFLDGAWHFVDPTGMANPTEIVRIGVGRDAADVSFMTSYGWMELIFQSVEVARVE